MHVQKRKVFTRCWQVRFALFVPRSLRHTSGVDKRGGEGQGGLSPPPPVSWRTTPVKYEIRGEIEGGGDEYVQSAKVRSFSAKSHSENAGNRICGTLDFKIFRGCMPPDRHRIARAFGACILPPLPNLWPWLRHCVTHSNSFPLPSMNKVFTLATGQSDLLQGCYKTDTVTIQQYCYNFVLST